MALETKTDVVNEYKRLRDFNQREPNAVDCDIRWKDTKAVHEGYIIALFPTEGFPFDDDVFFSADGIHGFLKLMGDNGEDFEIVSVNEFLWL